MIALASVCTATALLLLLPVRVRVRGAGVGPGVGRARWLPVLAVLGAAAVVLVVADSPRLLVLGLIGAGVLATGLRLLAVHRRDRAALVVRGRVIELCDAVQAELAAGQTPEGALDRAAADWPLVAPVARAAVTGGDVPGLLRALAQTPGGDALRIVAAAWHAAHRTGHGLADTLGRVAEDLRATEQTRRVVAGELASARATARLLAVLPLAALLMGSGAGGDPSAFLLGEPVGLACLAAGLAFGCAGLAWIEALARNVEAGR